MAEEKELENPKSHKYLNEILEKIPDPKHRRIVRAYMGDNPVQSMEAELGKIIMEIVSNED